MKITDQTIKELEEKVKQAKALKRQQEAIERREAAKARKKLEDRKKVLIGAMVKYEIDAGRSLLLTNEQALLASLDAFLQRNSEREIFGLAEIVEQERETLSR